MMATMKRINWRKTNFIEEWEKRCKEEEIYGDKSRVQWLKVGEKNTKFFHESTIAHRNHNKILKIRDHKGKELESHKEIENIEFTTFKT
jgi:hypothetical protein